jgi:calcineurin-like phosphoesterase family protein
LIQKGLSSVAAVSWLHISDVHLPSVISPDSQQVLDSFLVDLERLQRRPDFIVCSGDIGFSGKSEEYPIAEIFLDRLLSACKLPKNKLFVVPGNHDINRGLLPPGSPLVSPRASHHDIRTLLFGPKSTDALIGLAPYADFVRRYFDENTGHSSPPRFPFSAHRFNVGDTTIGIVALNSSYGCFGDADRHNCYIGEQQVVEALSHVADVDVRLAIVHHPFDWLHDGDRWDVEPILFDSCDFILHGDLHRQSLVLSVTPDSSAITIAAGALHEHPAAVNMYNVVLLDVRNGRAAVDLRRYVNEQGGYWTADTSTYKNAPTGTIAFEWAPARPTKAPPLARHSTFTANVAPYERWLRPRPVHRFEDASELTDLLARGGPYVTLRIRSARGYADELYKLAPDTTVSNAAYAIVLDHSVRARHLLADFPFSWREALWRFVDADKRPLDQALTLEELASPGHEVVVLLHAIPPSAGIFMIATGGSPWTFETLVAVERGRTPWRVRRSYFVASAPDRAVQWLMKSESLLEDVNGSAWALAEARPLETARASRLVECLEMTPGFIRRMSHCDTAAWVAYRERRYHRARALLFAAMREPPHYEAAILYHLYFVLRRLDENAVADRIKRWFERYKPNDPIEAMAHQRVMKDDDCLSLNDMRIQSADF